MTSGNSVKLVINLIGHTDISKVKKILRRKNTFSQQSEKTLKATTQTKRANYLFHKMHENDEKILKQSCVIWSSIRDRLSNTVKKQKRKSDTKSNFTEE